MTFADSWNSIQNSLDPGAQVKNWTAAKGYLGDVFTIVQVSPAHVVVSSPEAKNQQSVPKQDFQKLHGVWPGYCAGSVQRQEIRDMTRFSKYIISILHHIES
jgi:hypothetical protein